MPDAASEQALQPRRKGPSVQRHLVIVHQPGWQSADDWKDIGQRVRRIDPTTGVILASARHRDPELEKLAEAAPALVFSPGPLGAFQPRRGKVYHGAPMHKFEQLRRLAAGGVRVPKTRMLTPDAVLDPAEWGEFVVVKPTDMRTSSKGEGIQLMRTERVRYIAPGDYPAGHPGRLGPMVVQQFIDTGPQISTYRVLTLFGRPLYCEYSYSVEPRVDLGAANEAIETATIAIQTDIPSRRREFRYDADMVAMAAAAHRAIPEIPLKGVDILRDHRTGGLYVIEVNPNSNTWHFSSSFLAEQRKGFAPEFNRQRLEQLDAFGTAAHVLAEVARNEAE